MTSITPSTPPSRCPLPPSLLFALGASLTFAPSAVVQFVSGWAEVLYSDCPRFGESRSVTWHPISDSSAQTIDSTQPYKMSQRTSNAHHTPLPSIRSTLQSLPHCLPSVLPSVAVSLFSPVHFPLVLTPTSPLG